MNDLVHGGDIYSALEQREDKTQTIIDFSANINPLGLPDSVKEAITESIDDCINYPDPLCRKLKKTLGKKISINPDYIIFGNGASDLIFRLVLAKKPKKAMVLAPTFSEYEQALKTVDCEVVPHALLEENSFRLEDAFTEVLDDSLDMLFICNPNNPTGLLIDKLLLSKILDVCAEKDILLLLDECFLDFVKHPELFTMQAMIKDYKNLFILRAFTKSYAMPGLRLGYAICSNDILLENMFTNWQPWNVSVVAQAAGLKALEEDEYLEKSRSLVFYEQVFLKENLSHFGFEVYPSEANYIFFRIPLEKTDAYIKSFKHDLQSKGLLIRSCANYKGLNDSYFRIAVKTREENLRLIETIQRREEEWQKQ